MTDEDKRAQQRKQWAAERARQNAARRVRRKVKTDQPPNVQGVRWSPRRKDDK